MGSSNTFFSESHTTVPGCRRGERRPQLQAWPRAQDEHPSPYARFVTGSHTCRKPSSRQGRRTTRRIIFYRDTARGRQGHGAVCLRAAAFGGDRFELRRSLRNLSGCQLSSSASMAQIAASRGAPYQQNCTCYDELSTGPHDEDLGPACCLVIRRERRRKHSLRNSGRSYDRVSVRRHRYAASNTAAYTASYLGAGLKGRGTAVGRVGRRVGAGPGRRTEVVRCTSAVRGACTRVEGEATGEALIRRAVAVAGRSGRREGTRRRWRRSRQRLLQSPQRYKHASSGDWC
jgi:hypothetical protein